MSSQALVTGATGGLGRTLVPMLRAAGWHVRATGRRPRPDDDIVPIDLTRELPDALLDGVETVFHLAALSSPWGRRGDFFAINTDATGRLLDAARRGGCRRFVHVSTPAIHAEARDRIAIREDDPPARRFANAYAASKWAAEGLVRAADGQGLRTIIVRPHAIVGPDDAVLLPRLIRAMRGGRVPLPGGGSALIELTDARDVARALIAAGETDVGGCAITIAGGEPRSVRWIVERVAARLGMAPRIVAVPRRAALAGAALLEVAGRIRCREPLVTRYGIKILGWTRSFDLARAHDMLGWRPQVAPEDAIDHALERRCSA